MRLIDADAFDKCLEQVEIEATKSRKYVFSSAINTIRGNLANFPPVNQWIPVSERLPEFRHITNPDPEEDGEWDEFRFVLVCFDDGDIECRQFVREDGEVFVYPEEFRGRKPVAWQPLPDPWEEEE